jgi:hypothetical protein
MKMASKFSPVLMSKEADLERLRTRQSGAWQWSKGIHRYAGVLTIKGQSLVFRGMDVRETRDVQETIPLNKIDAISLGLDEQFDGGHNNSFVAGELKPLVIRYQQDGREETDYFVTNFPGLSSRVDGNQYWYETLKGRIDHSKSNGKY